MAWRALAGADPVGPGRRARNYSRRRGRSERAGCGVAGTAVCVEHGVEPLNRGGCAIGREGSGVAAAGAIVLWKKPGVDGQLGAARGPLGLFGPGWDA